MTRPSQVNTLQVS